MSRIPASNYSSLYPGINSGPTRFEWATSANDHFSRELDLASLARAVDAHDHTPGKGAAAAGFAPGSIPMTAFPVNPIFPTHVTIFAGGLDVTGPTNLTGNLDVAGTIHARDGITTNGSGVAVSAPNGSILAHTGLVVESGGMTVTGVANTINGPLSVTGAISAGLGSTLLIDGTITSANGNIVAPNGAISCRGGISTTVNGLAIMGSSSVTAPGGFFNLQQGDMFVSNGALTVSGAISHGTTGTPGATFRGQVNIIAPGNVGGLTVAGQASLPITGFTGLIQPATQSPAIDIGTPSGTRWGTLYAQHLDVQNIGLGTGSTLAGPVTITGSGNSFFVQNPGTTNLWDLTVNGNGSFQGQVGFTHQVTAFPSNTFDCGATGAAWRTVYAQTGTNQPSTLETKEHIEALTPDLALQVVLDTPIVEYQYRQSDEETGKYKSSRKARPRQERHVGYIADSAHPLLMVEDGFVNPQTTASVALAAIQALSAKIEALTARLAELEGPVH